MCPYASRFGVRLTLLDSLHMQLHVDEIILKYSWCDGDVFNQWPINPRTCGLGRRWIDVRSMHHFLKI